MLRALGRAGGSKKEAARPAAKMLTINYSWGIRVISVLFFTFFTFACNTECSNFHINCKCNQPQANCKLAENAVWTHMHRFALVLQTFTNQSHSGFNYSWHWPKSGPAMAWLARPLPPALLGASMGISLRSWDMQAVMWTRELCTKGIKSFLLHITALHVPKVYLNCDKSIKSDIAIHNALCIAICCTWLPS